MINNLFCHTSYRFLFLLHDMPTPENKKQYQFQQQFPSNQNNNTYILKLVRLKWNFITILALPCRSWSEGRSLKQVFLLLWRIKNIQVIIIIIFWLHSSLSKRKEITNTISFHNYPIKTFDMSSHVNFETNTTNLVQRNSAINNFANTLSVK